MDKHLSATTTRGMATASWEDTSVDKQPSTTILIKIFVASQNPNHNKVQVLKTVIAMTKRDCENNRTNSGDDDDDDDEEEGHDDEYDGVNRVHIQSS